MKKLIPLMILATVVSCGKKTMKDNGAQQITDMLTSGTKVGQQSNLKTSGEKHLILESDEKGILSSIADFGSNTTETVLKKEGSLVYTLIESDKTLEKKVRLEDLSETDEMSALIKRGKAGVNGEVYTAKSLKQKNKSSEDYKLVMNIDRKIEKNILKPCDFTIWEDEVEVVLKVKVKAEKSNEEDSKKVKFEESVLKNLSRKTESTCGEVLSNDELKMIDLTEVDFCDERKGNESCEKKDMSFLTSDL